MPSSRPEHLSWLCNEVIKIKPQKILDIGMGFGSKGMLFRDYTDVWNGNYWDWKVQIDAVEIFEKYLNPLNRKIYDNIYVGNIVDIVDKLDDYDFIYMGDVIEHIEKQQGLELIEKLKTKSKELIIVTQICVSEQGAEYGNKYETHISQWTPADFRDFTFIRFNNTMVAKFTEENPINQMNLESNKIVHYSRGMEFFGEKMIKQMGFRRYNPKKDKYKKVFFQGLYFGDDYQLLKEHLGPKDIYWNGSDIIRLLRTPSWITQLVNTKARHLCQTKWMVEVLDRIGIQAIVHPIFFGNLGKYKITFTPSDKPHIYLSCNPGREKEYGVTQVMRVAPELPEFTFHIYGIDGENTDNIIYHGRVEESVMDEEITKYHGMIKTAGTSISESLIKSILNGQYPVTTKDLDGIWKFRTDDELIKNLKRIKKQKKPNYKLRKRYLNYYKPYEG